jgi:hypothetical protein
MKSPTVYTPFLVGTELAIKVALAARGEDLTGTKRRQKDREAVGMGGSLGPGWVDKRGGGRKWWKADEAVERRQRDWDSGGGIEVIMSLSLSFPRRLYPRERERAAECRG